MKKSIVKAKEEVIGVTVQNSAKETLGEICEIMIEKVSGQVAYAVLKCGAVFGLGGKLFALPWQALDYNADEECFIVDLDKKRLEQAPGFDSDNWPDMSDRKWRENIASFYHTPAYFE